MTMPPRAAGAVAVGLLLAAAILPATTARLPDDVEDPIRTVESTVEAFRCRLLGTDGTGACRAYLAQEAGAAFHRALPGDSSPTVVAGTANEDEQDLLAVAFADDGARTWRTVFDRPGTSQELIQDAARSPDGPVYAVGHTCLDDSAPDCFETLRFDQMVVAFDDRTGRVLWSDVVRTPSGGPDLAMTVDVAPDGMVLVGGARNLSGVEPSVTAYTPDGEVAWVRTVPLPDDTMGAVFDLETTADGIVAAAAMTEGGADASLAEVDSRVLALEDDGALRWSHDVPDVLLDHVAAVPGGDRLAATGIVPTASRGRDARVGVFQSSGPVWQRTFDRGGGHDDVEGLEVPDDGSRVYVTGSGQADDIDLVVRALDAADGSAEWTRFHDPSGGSQDDGIALDLRPDGETLAVTGRTTKGAGSDWITYGHRAADGSTIWSDRVDRSTGPRQHTERPRDLAYDRDGDRLVVVGCADHPDEPCRPTAVSYVVEGQLDHLLGS